MDIAFPKCRGCVAAGKKIAELERQNSPLAARVEKQQSQIKQLEARLEALSRAAKRPAAPFSRGLPKVDPKRPGRKAGEDYGTQAFGAVPPVIDEVYEAPLPEKCPRCGGGAFRRLEVREPYPVEIPRRPIYRRFHVAIGQCACCGRLSAGPASAANF